jgi:plastocyanin
MIKFKDLKITTTKMNIKDVLNRLIRKDAKASAEEEESPEEINKGTKAKIVAALLVAGFATYVAWWVQEPTILRTDVLDASVTEETEQLYAENSDASQTEQTAAETQQNIMGISIIDFAFNPSEVSVEKGTTVIWTNMDAIPHSVTGDFFSSGTLNSDESFTYTFDEDGTYEYHCSFHPQMKGKIIVGSGISAETAQTEQMAFTTEETLPPALEENLAPAAPENAEELLPEETPAENAAIEESQAQTLLEQEHAAALEAERLAKSGPEDVLYAVLFLGVLFINRKRLFPKSR